MAHGDGDGPRNVHMVVKGKGQEGGKGLGVVFLHGLGLSGAAMQPLASFISMTHPDLITVVPDLLGHGTSDDCGAEEGEFEAQVVGSLVLALEEAKLPCSRLAFVGHSMGGSIAAKVASKGVKGMEIAGVCLLEVSETHAIASVEHFSKVAVREDVESRDAAQDWLESHGWVVGRNEVLLDSLLTAEGTKWRTDLSEWVPRIERLFRGCMEAYLSLPCPKLLVVGGPDRIDPLLTIPIMQGKLQIEILPGSHAIYEQHPEALAAIFAKFLARI